MESLEEVSMNNKTYNIRGFSCWTSIKILTLAISDNGYFDYLANCSVLREDDDVGLLVVIVM